MFLCCGSGEGWCANDADCTHMEWVERLIKMGGFDFFCELLFKSNKKTIKNAKINQKEDHDISRSIRVSCEAFLFQIVSLLLQMDRLFLHIIPPSTKTTVTNGAITGSKNFGKLQEKLIQHCLVTSQRILFERRDEKKDYANDGMDEKKEYKSNDDGAVVTSDINMQVAPIDDLGPGCGNILMESIIILVSCIRTSPEYIDTLFKMEDLTSWLSGLLFNVHYPTTRESVSKAVQHLYRIQFKDEKNNLKHIPIAVQLLNELIKILSSPQAQQPHCYEFFNLLLHVFDHVCRTYKDSDKAIRKQIVNIAYEAFEQLKSYKSREVYEKPELTDDFLIGVINLLRIAIQHHLFDEKDKIQEFGSQQSNQYRLENVVDQLIHYVFSECLLRDAQKGVMNPKCKNPTTRKLTHNLVQCIGDMYPTVLPSIKELKSNFE